MLLAANAVEIEIEVEGWRTGMTVLERGTYGGRRIDRVFSIRTLTGFVSFRLWHGDLAEDHVIRLEVPHGTTFHRHLARPNCFAAKER